MENTPIVDPANILLPHPPVLRPKHQIRRQPLETRSAPANRITDIPLPFNLLKQRPDSKMIRAVGVLCKDVLKLLRSKATLRIIRVRVGPVFRAVDVDEVDAEERIGEPGRRRRVGEVDVDYYHGEGGEDKAEAEVVEADEGVRGPEDAVAVAVEVFAVLLEDGLVAVLLRPGAFGGAGGVCVGCCDVGAGEALGRG